MPIRQKYRAECLMILHCFKQFKYVGKVCRVNCFVLQDVIIMALDHWSTHSTHG